MTDPEVADKTYIEPITIEMVTKIIARERPEALLPTLGGQTGLNTAVSLAEKGVLKEYGVELIGAKLGAIKKAEDRSLFKSAMKRIGIAVPESGYARSYDDAMKVIATRLASQPLYDLLLPLEVLAEMQPIMLKNTKNISK